MLCMRKAKGRPIGRLIGRPNPSHNPTCTAVSPPSGFSRKLLLPGKCTKSNTRRVQPLCAEARITTALPYLQRVLGVPNQHQLSSDMGDAYVSGGST
jgi:hypothetical protein